MNDLPISKEGLLAAIETAIDITRSGERDFAIEYLERLRQNVIDAEETAGKIKAIFLKNSGKRFAGTKVCALPSDTHKESCEESKPL